MLTALQIFCILQLLLAFDVSTSTVATVQAILEAPYATTTIVTPITTTPPVQNSPTPVFQFSGVVEPIPRKPLALIVRADIEEVAKPVAGVAVAR